MFTISKQQLLSCCKAKEYKDIILLYIYTLHNLSDMGTDKAYMNIKDAEYEFINFIM